MAELTNDDRAEFVRPLVQQFHDAHYFHPAGEPWSTVIMDMVVDLMHLYDRLPAAENEHHGLTGGLDSAEAMLERAIGHYEEEVELDRLGDEEDECTT